MDLPIYQIDAFSSKIFAGNPAAVCPLTEWLPDTTLQAIAAENNLSETAYFVPNGPRFQLRWFTPRCEVDLCGHATLASAFVLFHELHEPDELIRFETQSGELTVAPDAGLLAALGGNPVEILAARDYLVRYATEAEVRALTPDMQALTRIDKFAVIATAPGNDCDFVSRFFAPAKGVPEDPVTGSAHCTLTPYWAEKLGKCKLNARQISERGGELVCTLAGNRVKIAGRAALYLRGMIRVSA
jgi:predicted PhzF superfamily epimerase YddE/YHI9